MEKYNIIVTAATGIEAMTKRELKNLGIENSTAINGKINFDGTLLDIARCNMFLRTADKVMIKLAEFQATTFDELFDNIKQIPWENYLDKKGKYNVNGKSSKSGIFALSASQSIIKKAIIERLQAHTNTSYFPESGDEYIIDFNFFKDTVTISLNTSGMGLHKRGYRNFVGEAPLRETLASALIYLSKWDYEKPFIDPFCGSGTLPIEAALIANNIAPGKNRNFAFENYCFFNGNELSQAKEEAKENEDIKENLRISGFDINPKAIKLALHHAEQAGIKNQVHFQVQDAKNLSSRFAFGTIITNPPYGKRLLEKEEVNQLNKILGEKFVQLDRWNMFVITAAKDFERYFGKKATKNRKLFNATIECRFYQYFNK